MRRGWVALLAVSACVTTIGPGAALFPAGDGWRACVGRRLSELGYRVAAADSGGPIVARSRRGRLRADSVPGAPGEPPLLRVEYDGAVTRESMDSLLVSCSAVGGLPREATRRE